MINLWSIGRKKGQIRSELEFLVSRERKMLCRGQIRSELVFFLFVGRKEGLFRD